jgi:hypothetical protein
METSASEIRTPAKSRPPLTSQSVDEVSLITLTQHNNPLKTNITSALPTDIKQEFLF